MRRARLSFLCAAGLAAVWLSPALARAQEQDQPSEGSEEVIADPELGGAPTESSSSEQAINDPELSGLTQPQATATREPNGDVRVVLHSRLAMDTQWQGDEDVWESTHVALFEAHVRRSENLRFSVGLRARYMFAARAHEHADDGSGAARYELDVAPTAAFADVTAADGLHFRIGYQSVVLGRFDVLNASDILSTYDLRSGMTTMAEANEIAQPAVRMDWDIGSWLGLTAIVLPFFEPYRVHFIDGDYAIAPATGVSSLLADPQLTVMQRMQLQQLMQLQRTTLSRSGQAMVEDSAFYAFAPAPSFTHPQAALRLNAHDAAGELGFTAGIAREHLPAPHYSQSFLAALDNPMMAVDPNRPFGFDYDPFELLSVDAATSIGPVQIGVEAAYMFHRTFLSSVLMPDPNVPSQSLGLAEHTDLAHAGVRAELVQGPWVVVLEGTVERAMQTPGGGRQFAFMADGRWLLSSVGFVSFSPGDIGLTLELGGLLLNGPTYAFLPRVEQRLFHDFFVEAGAYFLGGSKRFAFPDPRATLGAVYDNIDQVFIGLRWLP